MYERGQHTRLNRRAIVPLALEVQEADHVRKQIPAGPDHIVQEVTYPNGKVHVKTNCGEWDFNLDEPVVFPRRPDGSKRDWRDATRPPTPIELAIGDIFPPRWAYPGDEAPSAAMWHRQFQILRAIHAHKFNGHLFWWLTMYENETGLVEKFLYPITASVVFPYPGPPSSFAVPASLSSYKSTKKRPITPYDGYGPYINPDGEVVFIAKHPSGNGRWPTALTEGLKINDTLTLVRPPGHTKEQWKGWTFASVRQWRRHPNDPGVPSTDRPAPRDFDDAYVHYRYPEDVRYEEDEQGVLDRRARDDAPTKWQWSMD